MNRLIGIGLIAVWLVPISALFQLPGERAVVLAESIRLLLQHTERGADQVAEWVRPEMAAKLRRDRDAAVAIAAEPALLEPSLWRRWVLELVAALLGIVGVWALWCKPRHWKFLTVLGLAAFGAVTGLHTALEVLWMTAGSWDLTLKVLSLYSRHYGTIVTHFVAPLLLVVCLAYVLSARGRTNENAA